ncbi:MAG: hypothetical protein HYW51_02635 [Candidatus Doudnabacteria bacterium]|nr:hypothetical protein [Candidatus Doudnabacteria bacterium]
MQNADPLDPIEQRAETPESTAETEQAVSEKRETKETPELRAKAAQYLENSDGKRTFVQTLKSFAAWLADQIL